MRIVLSGPPSVGKSTQGFRLAESLGVPHFSSGDIIREGARRGDPVAVRMAAIVADGSLAPSGAILALVLTRLEGPDCAGGFVVDGFPRRVGEAKALVDRYGSNGLDAFVVLEAGVDSLMARIRERARQSSLVREDDDPAVFPGRVATYLAETQPVREYMASRGVAVFRVDADPEVDVVQGNIRDVLLSLPGYRSVVLPEEAYDAPCFF